MRRTFVALGLAAMLASCAPAPTSPPYNLSQDVKELMGHVIDPAAFAYWRGSGSEVTEAGERDLSPTTPEGWKALEDGAATVAEAGNLLMMPGRSREPIDEWNRIAGQMTQRALEAKKAAEAKDPKAVFDTGGRLYETCVACHQQFIPK